MSADTRPRFVVLGASNVARGKGLLVSQVRGAHATSVEILAAHGRGRSYGLTSRLAWVRELGSIRDCGLWSELARRVAPTSALVCDVGNDLAYGVEPRVAAGWVEMALDRLLGLGARVSLAGLPLASLERLGAARFLVAKSILFPGRGLELARLVADARALDGLLAEAARARGVAFVRPAPDWFGVDPIHARLTARAAMWRAFLAPLSFDGSSAARPLSERWRLLGARPAVRRVLGWEQRTAQPCVRFADGTTLAEW